jgi:hypothetical protein
VPAAGARPNIEAAYERSHFCAVEVGVQDGHRPNEIIHGLATATGGRTEARVGGCGPPAHDRNR